MEIKEDIRILKTRRDLRNAIFKLVKTKSIEKISVTEICDTALVNRMTFYKYYEDKYMLLDDAMHAIADSMFESLSYKRPKSLEEASDYCSKLIETVIFTCYENREVLIGLKTNGNDRLLSIITNVAEQSISDVFNELNKIRPIKHPIAFLSAFLYGGFYSSISYWLEHPNSISQKDISNAINEFKKLITDSDFIFKK